MNRDCFIQMVNGANLSTMEKCKCLVERFGISFAQALQEVSPQEYMKILSMHHV